MTLRTTYARGHPFEDVGTKERGQKKRCQTVCLFGFSPVAANTPVAVTPTTESPTTLTTPTTLTAPTAPTEKVPQIVI